LQPSQIEKSLEQSRFPGVLPIIVIGADLMYPAFLAVAIDFGGAWAAP
jgi:hypothetical protein